MSHSSLNVWCRSKFKQMTMRQWFEKEIRGEGKLFEYMRREKLRSIERQRAVGKRMEGFQQNNKSEFKLLAAIPAREYHRWRQEDAHFWDDNSNLKRLKRDNPELQIFT